MAQGYAVNNINAGVNQLSSGGRLTLTSGTPVTTSDVTAATNVYFTPYLSGYQSVYNGSVWISIPFTEITIAVPASTSQMYDVFGYNNAGVLACDAPVAWTNDTTRATNIVLQNGRYVKSGDATRVYLGSFRTTTVSGQTEDSLAKRYVWNYYNRVLRYMTVTDATVSWTYSTATYRQARATTTNQLEMVIGVSEDMVTASIIVMLTSTVAAATPVAVGVNSTTVGSSSINWGVVSSSGLNAAPSALYNGILPAGRNTLVWLEKGAGSGTQTWDGNASGGNTSGITGYLRG
jgi:hypothetical protein